MKTSVWIINSFCTVNNDTSLDDKKLVEIQFKTWRQKDGFNGLLTTRSFSRHPRRRASQTDGALQTTRASVGLQIIAAHHVVVVIACLANTITSSVAVRNARLVNTAFLRQTRIWEQKM